MEKYGITPNELLLVKMIFICKDNSNGKEFIKRYFSLPENVRESAVDLLTSL